MKNILTKILCCPNCKGELIAKGEKKQGEEIIDGELQCLGCRYSYGIIDGVPRMIKDLGEREKISESYGFAWAKRAENKFECNTVYGKSEEEDLEFFLRSFDIQPSDLHGKRVLDAGCGCLE